LAAAITSSAVPPPNDWLSELKWLMKSALFSQLFGS